MSATREIRQGLQRQGIQEEIYYTLTTTEWGSNPSIGSTGVKVYSVTEGDPETYSDVTSTVMPTGTPSASGDVITLPKMKDLTLGVLYRVEILFTVSSNVLEAYAYIRAER